MEEALLKPNKLVPEIDSVPDNLMDSLSREYDKLPDLEPRSSEQEKLLSGPPNRRQLGWLRRIFSPAKPTSSSGPPTPIPNPGKINFRGDMKFCNGSYTEALKFYDLAIEISPNNATYLSNRAAALSRLGRVGQALYQWEEALRLDPKQAKARYHVAPFLFRLGHVDIAMKHSVINPPYYKTVKEHLNKCFNARRGGEWTRVLNKARLAIMHGANESPELGMCKVEALLKLQRHNEAQTALAAVPKVEPHAFPWPASFSQSQTRFFDMNPGAYTVFVKSQMDLALGRFDDAAKAATKALEFDPHNTEIKILKKNVELIQRAVSYSKLDKWAEAVRDFEMIIQALPYDEAIAKSLSQAKLALKLYTSVGRLN